MSVVIRLARFGSKAKPYYRMVVADSRYPKEGRSIETVGSYNPMLKPAGVKINTERFLYWHGRGARLTPTVASISAATVKAAMESLPPAATKKVAAPVEKAPKASKKPAAAAKAAKKPSNRAKKSVQ